MKRIARYITIIGLSVVLSAPVVEARQGRQGRGGSGTSGSRTEQTGGGSGSRAPGGQRPGGNPGGGNHNCGQRPGGNPGGGNYGGGGQRPGGNEPGRRPDNPGHRPGNNYNPGPGHGPNHGYNPGPPPGHGPGPRPGHHGGYHPTPPPPPRHDYWPGFHRPVPPPHYVYRPGGPSFGTIMGMVLGTAYNMSLNYLYNNGYNVVGSGNDAIYLMNVSQMSYNWPNAVLHYNNGMLASSQYIYSTSWHDMGRYNNLYNRLCAQYGYPASVNNNGYTMSASWFGYDGRFVTIQYSPGLAYNGTACYYTTLSFGN